MHFRQPLECLHDALAAAGCEVQFQQNRLIVPSWRIRLSATLLEQQVGLDETFRTSTVQVAVMFTAEPDSADEQLLWPVPIREIVTGQGTTAATAIAGTAQAWLAGLLALDSSGISEHFKTPTGDGDMWEVAATLLLSQAAELVTAGSSAGSLTAEHHSARELYDCCSAALQEELAKVEFTGERFWLSYSFAPADEETRVECWLNNDPWLLPERVLEHLRDAWSVDLEEPAAGRAVFWGRRYVPPAVSQNMARQNSSSGKLSGKPKAWWKFW